MAETFQISSFLVEFHQLKNAGLKACLLLECVNGEMLVNLQVNLGADQRLREEHQGRHEERNHHASKSSPSWIHRRQQHELLCTAAQVAAEQVGAVPLPPPLTEQVHPASVEYSLTLIPQLRKLLLWMLWKLLNTHQLKKLRSIIVMHLLFMIGALLHKPKLGSNVECPHDQCQDDYEAAPIIHFQPHPLPHQSSYPTHDINLVQ